MDLLVHRGIDGEVGGRRGLAVGDQRDEGVLAHRLHRRIGGALLPDSRAQLGREVLPAGRAGTVRGHDGDLIGQGQQLLVHRAVHRPGQVCVGSVAEVDQIRPAHVADEQ